MRICFAIILAMLMSAVARAADKAAMDRTLRVIDFEERRLGNAEELPMHWRKVEGDGMPHYVNGRLATDQARSGKYGFRFDLNGGSLVYRYNPGKIKVQARSHYRVETYVKTTPLPNARARLTAYFVDADSRPILSSIKHSEVYAGKDVDEPWKLLHVDLSAGKTAESLVMELELLQPSKYSATTLGEQTLFPSDIHGTAWFDDVSVSQVPKVKLSTDSPGNIFRRDEPLKLTVLVNDRSTDDLAAQLVITDAKGQTVYQRSGALDMAAAENLGPGLKRMTLLLPQLSPGWYEAGLVMTSRGQYVGRQMLDLVLLADNAPKVRPDPRFGIIATELPFDGWAELPQILPFLAAGRIKLAVWTKEGDIQQVDSDGFDRLLVSLQELNITPTAVLLDLPPPVTQKMRGTAWRDLLEAPPEAWQPQLAIMISRHANHLDRWQLGGDGSDVFVTQKEMRPVYQLVYNEFTKLVQKPDLAMPWPAWYELEGQLPATVALSVHPSVLPAQLPLYMQDIGKHEGHNLSLTLQALDREQYGREVQIRDLAQRVIYALAADAKRIDLPLPFTVMREEEDLVRQPKELLMVVRTLVTTLGGATFKGKVPIAEGLEAFLFDNNGQGILAIWDRGNESGVKQLALNLGDKPRSVDLWGNVTPLLRTSADRTNQKVQITVGPMPIFLVDIDGQLAQLRASVGFDRPLMESSFMSHTRHIRFTNPYRQAIGGSLHLKGPEGWTLNPPTMTFNVNPGETFDQEMSIEFPYNSFHGPKTITAEFSFQADRAATFTMPLTLMLGLTDVRMETFALRDGNDIHVQQTITNYGDKKIDYIAYAIFPGQARQERIITNLAAGRTTIKIYRFKDVKVVPNSKVRTGMKELNGTRILNDEVGIQ